MTESIQILTDELKRRRAGYAQLSADIAMRQQQIRDMDARAASISREMGDIERAIVALGGNVPEVEDARPFSPMGRLAVDVSSISSKYAGNLLDPASRFFAGKP